MIRLDFSTLYTEEGNFVAYNIRYEENGKVREFLVQEREELLEPESLIKDVLQEKLKTSL